LILNQFTGTPVPVWWPSFFPASFSVFGQPYFFSPFELGGQAVRTLFLLNRHQNCLRIINVLKGHSALKVGLIPWSSSWELAEKYLHAFVLCFKNIFFILNLYFFLYFYIVFDVLMSKIIVLKKIIFQYIYFLKLL
jgi:hypothetical protein